MTAIHNPKTNELTITIPCPPLPKSESDLPLSPSGKTRGFVNSGGNKPTTILVAGKPLHIGVITYIKA